MIPGALRTICTAWSRRDTQATQAAIIGFIRIFLDEILLVMFSLAAVLAVLLPNGSYCLCLIH